MQDPKKNWANFWLQQKSAFDELMKVSTAYFANQFLSRFRITSDHEIFDFGCGPGFLVDLLAPRGVKITGADINESYLEVCRKNHPAHTFVQITTNTVANAAILKQNLNDRKFDFVILLSISQYLQDVDELSRVIALLQTYVKDDGKIIVADVVDENTSAVIDVIAIFKQCMKSGKLPTFFRFISYLFFSNYRSISKGMPLLRISNESMVRLSASNKMQCKEEDRLTLHPTRSSYILSRMH